MDGYSAAIGRDVGKVDTDSGGIARYSLKLSVPPGILSNTEPELSLEYFQAGANGSLGAGWALGGLSTIRRGPSSLAQDGINPGPANYNRSESKLSLDGAELLNVQGEYWAADAQYTTEVEGVTRTVTALGSGFLVRDSTGHRSEYGTTDDSRVVVSGQQMVREWRLKKSIDYHGNAISYDYTSSPRPDAATTDINACYLSSIRYTSNVKTGYQGNRLVRFEYSSRPDLIVQTVQGDKCVWASLLTAIRFAVIRNDAVRITRSYELAYTTSPSTGDSLLTSVVESSFNSNNRVNLLPSTFGYTSPGVSGKDTFKPASQRVMRLTGSTNNVALFPMNISGRCMSDLAMIRYDRRSKSLSLKTYIAERTSDGTVGWRESDGPGAVASLPSIDLDSRDFPSILQPDLNNDGRSDFVIPYADSNDKIRFSVSVCVGTGFKNARSIGTDFRWTDGSKFMAMDLTGRGTVDFVQIFTDQQKLTFRNFPSINKDGDVELQDAILTRTNYDNTNTIDWVQLRYSGTGARSLVRVWTQDLGRGQRSIKATAFVVAEGKDSRGGFKEGPTSVLVERIGNPQTKYHVVPCDINADGSYDIVLMTVEHREPKMVFYLTTYLGDGKGGFAKHGNDVVREAIAPTPQNAPDYGSLYMTNFNGSNYPSISYVYPEKRSGAYTCLTVDGRSDGFFREVVTYRIGENLPPGKIQLAAADLNGNSMGDWLFYTLTDDSPRVMPEFNKSNITGFLSWAQDPMGLRTDLEYRPMTDPSVYKSSVDWKTYTNDSKDGYPVIAAPNYVVTSLEHRNDSAVNSLDYSVSIKKTYTNARVNTSGRGWLGFEEITTLNNSDQILTTEKYFQKWPISGMKSQVDTKTIDGQLLKSVKSAFNTVTSKRGQWTIHRIDRTLEQTDMLENGGVVRSNTSRQVFDTDGNMVVQTVSETQRGQSMFQSWKRCAYTTIDGVTSVLTGEKLSDNERNINMNKFEPGDSSLVLYENQPAKAILKASLTWSTDVGSFSRVDFDFDDYGHEVRRKDAAGLTISTTYDALFRSFPVKVTETGSGVSITELTAFDEGSGLEVGRVGHDGLLSCFSLDGFGRTLETRVKAAERSSSTITATKFLANSPFIADQAFIDISESAQLDPQRTISFDRQKSKDGLSYISVKVVTFGKDGVFGQQEVVDIVDCVKRPRKRSSRNGTEADRTWVSWEYNSQGQTLFEGFPTKIATNVDVGWTPDRLKGIRSTVDTLGRTTMRVRPAHGVTDRFIVSATTYLEGGSRVQERTLSSKDYDSPMTNAIELAMLERRYIHIDKKDLVIENVDENRLRSTFQYDPSGNLIKCVDARGQTEIRTYNSRGSLTSVDNSYQNLARSAGTAAVKYQYDAANFVISETNANHETVTFKRDARGRALLKVGQDGRTIQYVYNVGTTENLASIRVFPRGVDSAPDSKLELKYDHRGRVYERKLTLADSTSYTTTISYDWQDRITQKVLPDGVTVTHEHRGSEVASSTLSGGTTSTWSLKAETLRYSPQGRPQRLTLQGTGMKDQVTHEWQYDAQGFPLSHSLSTNDKSLTTDYYLYNDLDQLERKHEFLSGSTMEYLYSGRRLMSSTSSDNVTSSYTYDEVGNLKEKRGTTLTYSQGRITGTRNGLSTFDVTYDGMGRMSKKVTSSSALSCSYDSFGALRSIDDSKTSKSIDFLTDFEGELTRRKQSDGSSDLFIGEDFSIHTTADGSRTVHHRLASANAAENSGVLIGTVSNKFESSESKRPLGGRRVINLQFTDTKGNVTHVYNGIDMVLREKFEYDDFGGLNSESAEPPDHDATSTYEANYLDEVTGLLNFGGRWYDPMVGRFTTPDDILDNESLTRTDGLNRYAFENNDPINNVDPTGHWSWASIFGVIVSTLLIVGAIAVTIATGGAAASLAGALAGAGVAGIIYSVKNKDERDAGKFFAGFGLTLAINAVIGAVSAGAGAIATQITSAAVRIAVKATIAGISSVLTTAAERGVDNVVYGKHHSLFEGWATTFAGGFAIGFGVAVFSGGPTISKVLNPATTNAWLPVLKAAAKQGGKEALKAGLKLGWFGAKMHGVDDTLKRFFLNDKSSSSDSTQQNRNSSNHGGPKRMRTY